MSKRDRNSNGLEYLLEDVPETQYGPTTPEADAPDPAEAGKAISDSRRHNRKPFRFDVLFERSGEQVLARGSNLSPGGMCVATRRGLPKGEVVSATIQVEHREIKIIAEVVWARNDDPTSLDTPPGMGLKFLDIEDTDAEFVRTLVSLYER